MSQTGEERVQAFRDAVNASPEQQAKVTAEDTDWIEIAKAAGHEITVEEVKAYMTAHENDELSDFELEVVSGGFGRRSRNQLWIRADGSTYFGLQERSSI